MIDKNIFSHKNLEKLTASYWQNKDQKYWQSVLTPQEYAITRQKDTERAFIGEYCTIKQKGKFVCKCCQNLLFDSNTKFDSGSGWPSYFAPTTEHSITIENDFSHGMTRSEVLCARCLAHLGHVFNDGPAPTGLRYCINSLSLKMVNSSWSILHALIDEKTMKTLKEKGVLDELEQICKQIAANKKAPKEGQIEIEKVIG